MYQSTSFDADYISYICEQHAFCPDLSFAQGYSAVPELRFLFLLWVAELSMLPCVRLDQLTHLLIWSRNTFDTSPHISPLDFISGVNTAWKGILLTPPHANNPAVSSRTLRYISSQYSTLTLNSLAHSLGLNSSYLSRAISSSFDCTFLDLLHCRRILIFVCTFHIQHESISLDEISDLLGYSSMHYFHCVFKRYTGISPAKMKAFIDTWQSECSQES